jgi:hypothetical protein
MRMIAIVQQGAAAGDSYRADRAKCGNGLDMRTCVQTRGPFPRVVRDTSTRPPHVGAARIVLRCANGTVGNVDDRQRNWAGSFHLASKQMLRTTVEGEHFLHKILWITTKRQMEHAEEKPTGAFYDYLASMVFASHSLEAYLNFIGERLAPEFWQDERKHFRTIGFGGKVRKVLELSAVPEPDEGSRPYRTILELKKLRDMIAHAKIERFSQSVDHLHDDMPERYRTPIDLMVTPENAGIAIADVEAFANRIHAAAGALVQDVWFGKTAFDGVLRRASGHTTFAR